MISLHDTGVFYKDGKITDCADISPEQGRENTMAYQVLRAHDESGGDKLRIRFDALISHDITYVGIIQTARASGMLEFPLPYAMTNCHNSLCAVGGTINADDHIFGLSAAKKYGGIYVPANQSVIHSYAREALARCGSMILGSDSHTRYGALGTMGIGEGGPELVKQLLKNTYDVPAPQVVLVNLTGAPRPGVGPHDVALLLVAATFKSGFAKNKVLEFVGEGIANLSVDFRNGIDVMTTETTCLSSIWQTDGAVRDYYAAHGRADAYSELSPISSAYYDSMIHIELDKVEPMIALPFHPGNAYTIQYFLDNAKRLLEGVEAEAHVLFGDKISVDLLSKLRDGHVYADQGVIAGCAGGTMDNIMQAAAILKDGSIGNDYFELSVYPTSIPVSLALTEQGATQSLLSAGAVLKPSFCGPCFGAGDVPSNNGLSLRHTTRNFPNREGAKPGDGQLAMVALMDARSIAATARNGGVITPATQMHYEQPDYEYKFDSSVYAKRVYNGFGHPQPHEQLRMGPNITDWPNIQPLTDNVLLELAAVIRDEVTTTDELIPSGETSSYRSNPLRLAEFTLSRRVPEYVGRSKAVYAMELLRRDGDTPPELADIMRSVGAQAQYCALVSCVFANKPGDGSAREQAASCQRVLGGGANICYEYATKRYRSNCINWGILPFTIDKLTPFDFEAGEYIYVPNIRQAVAEGISDIPAKAISGGKISELMLHISALTPTERQILLDGCLMNYYTRL
ncbi:MAG: hydratase [Clostridia bacterium]